MQKILIIGASGFIGKNLVEYYQKLGLEVYQEGRHKPIQAFDYVINCAGTIHTTDFNKLIDNNITAPLFYASEYYKLNSAVKFLHLGSSSEYGFCTSFMEEKMECKPVTSYGLSKLIGTKSLLEFQKFTSCQLNIIRPFSIYGKHDHNIKFIPTLIKKLKENDDIEIFKGSHDWMHIEDFCSLCNRILVSNFSGHIFNAGTGVSTSNKGVVDLALQHITYSGNIIEKEILYRSYDTQVWKANMSKVRQLLSWSPYYSLERGLYELIQY